MSQESKATPHDIPLAVMELLGAGGAAWGAHDYVLAKACAENALTRAHASGSAHGALGARHLQALIAFNECRDAEARDMHTEVLTQSLQIGFYDGAASALTNLALLDIVDGDYDAARERYRQAERWYRDCANADMADVVADILCKEDLDAVLASVHREPGVPAGMLPA